MKVHYIAIFHFYNINYKHTAQHIMNQSCPGLQLTPAQLDRIAEQLIAHQSFMSKVAAAVSNSQQERVSISKHDLNLLIEEITGILEHLIKKKIENEMCELIDDNNRILEEIKFNLEKNQPNKFAEMEGIEFHDASFTDIHNLINEEKKKALEQMTDAEAEKSMSVMEKYEDVFERVYELNTKIKILQDKYETNFKSLWNVLSMTESALFDFIKEHKMAKQNIQEQKKAGEMKNKSENSSFFNALWK